MLVRLLAVAGLFVSAAATAQTTVFFNELHYDNTSTDSNESIEVAGPANASLAGWSLVLYNGGGGASYGTLDLSGFVPDLCGGYGAVSVPAAGMQNGSPDGVALVNASGTVVQFLSYEGAFTASNGPAMGMLSTDIGVSENGSGADTASLALTGTGSNYETFSWAVAPVASFGGCNLGQTFVGGVDNPPSVASVTPANATPAAPIFTNLTVTFSEPVTLAGDWFQVTCASTGSFSVAGATISGGPRAFTINPNTNFANAESCSVTIRAAQVTDNDGTLDHPLADYSWSFTTAPDVAPTISSVSPGNGATGVWTGANVRVTFSEPVTAQPSAFSLSCGGVSQSLGITAGASNDYRIDPASELPGSVACTFTITAAQVVDQDGTPNALASNFSSSFTTGPSTAQYYAAAHPSSAAALRTSLHTIIKDHTRFPYTASSTDTWDILDLADEDPANPSNVLDIYKNASYPKAGGGNPNYNREHTWAKSYGFPDDTSTNWPYTDTHHLMVSDSGYNSARNNRYFDYCASGCTEYPTQLTNGQGGGSGTYPGNSNWGGAGRWEVWRGRRGDVARAVLYMDVRYEGGTNTFGSPEPDLVLTNDPLLIVTTGGNTTGTAYLGLLSVLIEWSELDPPDELETLRNALVQTYQGNRNPFVDHPEWVACVFEAQCALPDNLFADGFE